MEHDSSAGAMAHAGRRPEGEYITLRQLADWLGISRGTAWSIVIEKGEIPHVRISDRVVRVARGDVEDYLARCRSDAVGTGNGA